jgi:hypothetical protein
MRKRLKQKEIRIKKKSGDFLLFTGTIQKTAESAEARRENNTPLRLSATSAVNLFFHDLFIQNKLKSHEIRIKRLFSPI